MPVNPECKNGGEQKFVTAAIGKGWTVVRAGWPDFLLVKKNGWIYEYMAVEVKRDFMEDGLSEDQMIVLNLLHLHGIKCYVYSVRDGKLRTPDKVKLVKRSSGGFYKGCTSRARQLAIEITRYVRKLRGVTEITKVEWPEDRECLGLLPKKFWRYE